MTDTLIRFGTDGWRALIAEEYTFDNVRSCAEGVARYLEQRGLAQQGLVIGFDTRFGSENFAAACSEVLAYHNIRTYLFDSAASTPIACHAVKQKQAAGAIIITASHNPGSYNGFKYKPAMYMTDAFEPAFAGSAAPEITEAIETHIDAGQLDGLPRRTPIEAAIDAGLASRFDPRPAYDEQVARLIDTDRIRRAGLNIVFDAMHATGATVLTRLLSGGATRVQELRAERNPSFPGMVAPEPIARNLAGLSAAVVDTGADIGLATDGDADRLGVVDEKGHFVDQLQTFALLCYAMLEYRGQRSPIVRSLTSTRMIDKLGALYGVPVYETQVGFKYLGPRMLEVGAMAAGEESGGYAFAEHLPERDGCFAGMLMLDLLARSEKSPSDLVKELYSKVGEHFYDRIDVHISSDQKPQILERIASANPDSVAGSRVVKKDAIDGFRFELDAGWLLIRPSGTEPVLRIYTETTDQSLVRPILEAGREIAGV